MVAETGSKINHFN